LVELSSRGYSINSEIDHFLRTAYSDDFVSVLKHVGEDVLFTVGLVTSFRTGARMDNSVHVQV